MKGLIVRTFSTGQHDEADEGNTGHAVGFKTVRRGAHAVAGIVAGTVRDYSGVSRVVFFDVEDDFHQVRADIRDLGKDTAADTQGADAPSDSPMAKPIKAGTGYLASAGTRE